MKRIYKAINKCRICGNKKFVSLLALGNQYLTGIFPKTKNKLVPSGPLELIKCDNLGNKKDKYCGLVQLRHSYTSSILYGTRYGYRSGLNSSMVEHLHKTVKRILSQQKLTKGDLVIDIGSNDSTLLKEYPKNKKLFLLGIDPTGKKFAKYYSSHIRLIPNFFSAKLIKKYCGVKKAKVITSIAMFYDLDKPLDFMQQVYDCLDNNGIWLFEQSYLPTMLGVTAYDTICHEHLEYYSLKQIKWMTDRVGFKIINVDLNNVNGGSFSVTVAKTSAEIKANTYKVNNLLTKEKKMALDSLKPYLKFKEQVYRHKQALKKLIANIKHNKKTLFGYGASTKGNVILQFCGLTKSDIPFIAEVNEDKFGSFTPGTKIPIISESEVKKLKPDYLLVMPWHFRENIIKREKEYLARGGKLIFPLPEIEIVARK